MDFVGKDNIVINFLLNLLLAAMCIAGIAVCIALAAIVVTLAYTFWKEFKNGL